MTSLKCAALLDKPDFDCLPHWTNKPEFIYSPGRYVGEMSRMVVVSSSRLALLSDTGPQKEIESFPFSVWRAFKGCSVSSISPRIWPYQRRHFTIWTDRRGGAVDPPKQATASGTGGQVYILRINHVVLGHQLNRIWSCWWVPLPGWVPRSYLLLTLLFGKVHFLPETTAIFSSCSAISSEALVTNAT